MRRTAALTAVGLLVAGAGALLAAPAQAGSSTAPTYDASTRSVSATITRAVTETVVVTLTGPDYRHTKDYGLTTATRNEFTAPGVIYNGLYELTVRSNNATSPEPRRLAVEAPPAPPGDVTATSGAVGVVTVSWNSSSEPDRRGYEVLDGGESIATVNAACNGRCSATLSGLAPGERAFAVVAKRACPTCSSGTISATSAPATATVRAPDPVPVDPTTPPGPGEPSTPVDPGTPTAPGQPGPGTGVGPSEPPGTPVDPSAPPVEPSAGPVPGTGGLGTGGVGGLDGVGGPVPGGIDLPTTPRQGRSSFGGFSGFGSSLAVPGLGSVDAPEIGGPGEPDGTFEPELAYDNEIREDLVSGSDTQSALGPISDAIDSEQLMRTLAAALVLLLTGAHLRRWLSDSTPG